MKEKTRELKQHTGKYLLNAKQGGNRGLEAQKGIKQKTNSKVVVVNLVLSNNYIKL